MQFCCVERRNFRCSNLRRITHHLHFEPMEDLGWPRCQEPHGCIQDFQQKLEHLREPVRPVGNDLPGPWCNWLFCPILNFHVFEKGGRIDAASRLIYDRGMNKPPPVPASAGVSHPPCLGIRNLSSAFHCFLCTSFVSRWCRKATAKTIVYQCTVHDCKNWTELVTKKCESKHWLLTDLMKHLVIWRYEIHTQSG